MMNHYWPASSATLDTLELKLTRQNLVMLFNQIVGTPSADTLVMQAGFIDGTLPYEEALAYARYAEYMVSISSRDAAS